MGHTVTAWTIRSENTAFAGTGGVSQNNRSLGFQPGFIDTETGVIDISRFAGGRPAPVHMLDGVPREWVTRRNETGQVAAVKGSVVSGFIHDGRFFTRQQAAALVSRDHLPA